ncbi:TetR/AcrR family transcriptional regulator C-terminal domain-containing protein [Actinomadura sp. GTD37]|uniref:TetR/AcrR family transcriptional regulator C-terminal domain-containing protein n=1 Tax=Actinomadura sp. GTD37 TaxID=1778030 RepID=UPI0035BED95B
MYWHVGSKDDLVLLATDLVWGDLALPDPDAIGWRAAAAAMAADLYRMFTGHPWLVQVFAGHVVYGESKARHDEHQLAVYEAGGFTGAEADRAAAAVFTYVLGNAAGVAATASLTRKLDRNGDGAQKRLAEAMTTAQEIAARFPRLRARLETAAATGYAASPDQTFEFGLRALLDGLSRSDSRRG